MLQSGLVADDCDHGVIGITPIVRFALITARQPKKGADLGGPPRANGYAQPLAQCFGDVAQVYAFLATP